MTSMKNLQKRANGMYYVRVNARGKCFYCSLRTADPQIARVRADIYLAKVNDAVYGAVATTGEFLVYEAGLLPIAKRVHLAEICSVAEHNSPMHFRDPPGWAAYLLVMQQEVVYVGMTKGLAVRLADHRSKGKVFDQVLWFEYLKVDDARRAEKELIKFLKPRLNDKFVPRNPPG